MVVTMPAVIASASEAIQKVAKRDGDHRGLSRKNRECPDTNGLEK
jgi:hypothetical protein